MSELKIIKCPHCNWEYLPGEIFLPNNFLGQPTSIVRDPLGKIIYNEYLPNKELDTEETYTCDNCDRTFRITADIAFKSKPEDEAVDFSQQETRLF